MLCGQPCIVFQPAPSTMFDYQDTLQRLNENLPLTSKFVYVHDVLRQRYPFIDRIAAALYEPETDTVKTFVHSSGGDQPPGAL